MAFDADFKIFNGETFAEYVKLLASKNAFFWVTSGFTLHHTYSPTVASWRGFTSLSGIRNYYISLGWTSGPQIFVAPEGIYQFTPVHHRGIHAGICNSTRIGIEVVGNYDLSDWSKYPSLEQNVYATLDALYAALNFPVNERTLVGHRDCASPKSCPGSKIYLDRVRYNVKNQTYKRRYFRVIAPKGINVRASADSSSPAFNTIVDTMEFGAIFVATMEDVAGMEVGASKVWYHRADYRGFASSAWLEPI